MTTPPDRACANCGAKLQGEYCFACGQKRFDETDRRFGNLVRQFVESATDLDGRFWGTVRALLFQPGRLSRDYMEGRRARWMSPVPLFLLINLVYFFFAPQSDFTVPFEWEVPGQLVMASQDPETVTPEQAAALRERSGPFYADMLGSLVEQRVQARDAAERNASGGERGYDYSDFREAYNAKVPEVSKALAVLHVPFLALALMFMFRSSRRYYAEHFVVALHVVAFYMATILVFGYGTHLVQQLASAADWHYEIVNWLVRVAVTTYIVIALRRAYARHWLLSAAGTAGLFLAYVLVNFCLYRPVLFLLVSALV